MLDLLRGGDSARLFVSSLVGRAPATALSLVLVLRTKELTGSFAAAGLASGSHALASAMCSPVLGRIVGVDLADPSFWDRGLDLVAEQLDAAEQAAEEVMAGS